MDGGSIESAASPVTRRTISAIVLTAPLARLVSHQHVDTVGSNLGTRRTLAARLRVPPVTASADRQAPGRSAGPLRSRPAAGALQRRSELHEWRRKLAHWR